MVYKKFIKRDGKTYGPYFYKSIKKDGKVITRYLGTEKPNSRRGNSIKTNLFFVFISLIFLSFIFLFISSDKISFTGFASSGSGDTEYVELLVKTSDNVLSKLPKDEWTSEMFDEERAANMKQGYIMNVKPEGWTWGSKELDPKGFVIVKIPSLDWDESWLEPEYDGEGNKLTARKYRLPLENFLTVEELEELRNIPYNDENYREPIIKTVENIAELIEEVDWNNQPEEMILHGSSGTYTICPAGCDYTSLSAWEGDQKSDLTSGGPCIASITGDWSGTEDNTAVEITGWTTTAADYIKITTDADNHASKEGWKSDRYRLMVTDNLCLGLYEDYIIVEGVQMRSIYSSLGSGQAILTGFQSGAGNQLYLDSCRIETDGGLFRGATGLSDTTNFTIYNSIFYNLSWLGVAGSFNNLEIYNSIFYKISSEGIFVAGTVTNTVVADTSNDFNGGTIDYCASDDGDGTNAVAPSGGDWNNEFGDPAHGNFTLLSGGNLEDGGTNDPSSGVFSDDIDGETRSGTWDIGADEITGDSTNPTISITTPTNNTNTTDILLDVNFTSSDDVAVDSCWYSNDTYTSNLSLGSGGICANVTNITWVDGQHNVTIYVNDSSGNENSADISFTVDTGYPDVLILFPTNNSNYSLTTTNVNYTALDIFGLKNCWYSNDSYSINTSLANCNTNLTTITWAEGQHNVTIWANDSAGNVNSSRISFRVDITPPYFTHIKNISMANNTAWGYDFDAEDADVAFGCFSVNDTTNFEINCSGWINNITSLSPGDYNINITINDTVNNLNSTLITIKSVQINSTEFLGSTTDFNSVSDLSNISGLALENPEYGKINFSEVVNLENGTDLYFVNISFNRIEINSSANAALNKSSKLSLYNLTFSNPRILKDGVVCPPSICTKESYSGGILIFDVTHFTVYSAEETPSTPVTTSPSGGGGGSTSFVTQFTVDIESYEKTDSINSIDFGEIVINNPLKYENTYTIEVQNLEDIVLIEEDTIVVEPQSSGVIKFKVLTPDEPGLYVGRILIKSGSYTKYIPISLNVKSEKNLFDVTLFIPNEMKTISPGSTISSQINLLEMGYKENIDVTLHYMIKDFLGGVYLDESETLAVYDQKDVNKEFSTEGFAPGDYILGVELIYPEGIAVASSQFKVQEELFFLDLNQIILIAILVGIVLIFVVTFFAIKRYESLTKKLKRNLNKKKKYIKKRNALK